MTRIAFIVLLLPTFGVAQGSNRIEFEVASLKPSQQAPGSGGGCRNDPGRSICRNMGLSDMIITAYGVPWYLVSAPDWVVSARFDFEVKLPEGVPREQFGVMMRAMLEDRLKIAVHHENREMQEYELVVAKNGPNFKEASQSDKTMQRPPTPGPPQVDAEGYPVLPRGRIGISTVKGHSRMYLPQTTMESFAAQLAYWVMAPVSNATHLTGQYEITISWLQDSVANAAVAGALDTGPTLMQALQDQLGLRLERRKGMVDVLVIDHVEKVPTEN